ncbi:unnamed protein product [Symbiodinium natans]|uniref:Uncharacterized protein n=1 Tax=Symbiodinium natans TaxID=878477 RepID=A0A812V640_9DINO|nr:unnamed protein product [Symbiodinium natans]
MASKGRVTDADGQRWDNSGWPHYGALTWKYIYLGQAHMDGLREIGRAVRVEACGRLAEASVPRKLIAEFVVATLAKLRASCEALRGSCAEATRKRLEYVDVRPNLSDAVMKLDRPVEVHGRLRSLPKVFWIDCRLPCFLYLAATALDWLLGFVAPAKNLQTLSCGFCIPTVQASDAETHVRAVLDSQGMQQLLEGEELEQMLPVNHSQAGVEIVWISRLCGIFETVEIGAPALRADAVILLEPSARAFPASSQNIRSRAEFVRALLEYVVKALKLITVVSSVLLLESDILPVVEGLYVRFFEAHAKWLLNGATAQGAVKVSEGEVSDNLEVAIEVIPHRGSVAIYAACDPNRCPMVPRGGGFICMALLDGKRAWTRPDIEMLASTDAFCIARAFGGCALIGQVNGLRLPRYHALPRAASDKVIFRRKLLPRLPAKETPRGGELAWDTSVPFEPPCRVQDRRPQTAERSVPLSVVSFPAQLCLRARGETPGPLGLFGSPEALVIPLETQDAVKDIVAACAKGTAPVMDGSCLTLWTLVEARSQAMQLEPIAARRINRSLAVEPIELVAERQGDGPREGPIRFGEGFRLRAAGCGALYLGYPGSDGLCWKSGDEPLTPPAGTRFSAHGGELGAPLSFGRPVSLRWVPTPPPSEATESDLEDDERPLASESEEASHRPCRGAARDLLPEAARYAQEGLYSRVADKADSAVPVVFLPLCTDALN